MTTETVRLGRALHTDRPSSIGFLRLGELDFETKLFYGLIAIAAAFVAVIGSPLYTGRLVSYNDVGDFILPMRYAYADRLQRGIQFDWMPEMFNGWFATGEGQLGGYHPMHLLLYRFLPITTGIGIEIIGTFVFELVGTFLFLRMYVNRCSAMIAAIGFTFTFAQASQIAHFMTLQTYAHLPWLLWSIKLTTSNHRYVAINGMLTVAITLASQLLLGSPPFMWYSLIVAGIYFLHVQLFEKFSLRSIVYCAGGSVLAGLLGAVQIAATFSFLRESSRANVSLDFVNIFAVSASKLTSIVAPYWLIYAYFGAVGPLLLGYWISMQFFGSKEPDSIDDSQARVNKRLVYMAIFVGIIGMILSLGVSGGLFYLHWHLPIVGRFRIPLRFLLLTHFSFAVILAVSFNQLWNMSQNRSKILRRHLIIPAIVVALAAIASVCESTAVGWQSKLVVAPLLFVGSLAGLNMIRNHRRVGFALLACILAVDTAYFSLGNPGVKVFWKYPETQAAFENQIQKPPSPTDGRVESTIVFISNRMTVTGHNLSCGYAALSPQKFLDYERSEAMRLAGVEWFCPGFFGTENTVAVNQWTRVEIPVKLLGIKSESEIKGMRFRVKEGIVTWGRVGKVSSTPEKNDSVDRNEFVWFNGSLPDGAETPATDNEPWKWSESDLASTNQNACHTSNAMSSICNHSFVNAEETLNVSPDDRLFVDLCVRRAEEPAVMAIGWQTENGWRYAFWSNNTLADANFFEPLSEPFCHGSFADDYVAPAKEGWRRVSNPLPRARLVSQAVVSKSPREDIRKIDVEKVALTEIPLDLDASEGQSSVIEEEAGDIKIQATSTGRQLLVLNESFHSGWKVLIDGKPSSVMRTYGDFLGCVVEKGEHEIEFKFDPGVMKAGKWASILGVVVLLGLVIFNQSAERSIRRETTSF